MQIGKRFRKKKNKSTLLLGVGLILVIAIFAVCNILFFLRPTNISSHLQQKEAEKIAKSFAESCSNVQDWRGCYGTKFALFTKTASMKDALQLLHEVQGVDLQTRDCHIMAHKITGEMVAKDLTKWESLLDDVDPNDCNYGFIHGIVEARARFDSNFVLNAQTIPAFCQVLVEHKKMRGVDQTCAHIIGHLLLAQEYGKIDHATAICWELPEVLQRECFGGIFMENYTRDNLVIHGIAQYAPWDEELISRQETLCNSFQGNAGLGCWEQMANLYNSLYNNDPTQVYERCQRASEEDFANQCYQFGLIQFMTIEKPTPAYYAGLCARYNAQIGEYQKCASVAIRSVTLASSQLIPRAFDFCDASPTQTKYYCYQILGRALSEQVTQATQKELCQQVKYPFTSVCEHES